MGVFSGVTGFFRGLSNDFMASQREPVNAFFTGGLITFVVAAAALSSMRLDDSLSVDQRYNFRLSIGAVVFVLVTLWIYRIWVHPTSKSVAVVNHDIDTQLHGECEAMIAYALERGLEVGAADIAALESLGPTGATLNQLQSIEALNTAHQRLVKIVHPAMPKTLYLLRTERSQPKVFPWLGPVRLVRMFMILGVLLVPLFVVLGLSVGVTADGPQDEFFGGNLVERSRVALYLVTSATIGSTFAGLTKAFRYIGNLSYDDKYESSYWVRLVLGIVSGLILSIVLSQALFSDGAENGTGFRLTVPLLAIVGGFSSDLVYKLLRRMIDALETLVSGSASEQVASAMAEAEARTRSATLDEQAAMARQLIAVRDLLPAEADEARGRIDQALANTLGDFPPALHAIDGNDLTSAVALATGDAIEATVDGAGVVTLSGRATADQRAVVESIVKIAAPGLTAVVDHTVAADADPAHHAPVEPPEPDDG